MRVSDRTVKWIVSTTKVDNRHPAPAETAAISRRTDKSFRIWWLQGNLQMRLRTILTTGTPQMRPLKLLIEKIGGLLRKDGNLIKSGCLSPWSHEILMSNKVEESHLQLILMPRLQIIQFRWTSKAQAGGWEIWIVIIDYFGQTPWPAANTRLADLVGFLVY